MVVVMDMAIDSFNHDSRRLKAIEVTIPNLVGLDDLGVVKQIPTAMMGC